VLTLVLTSLLAADAGVPDAGLPPLPSALFRSASEALGLVEVEIPLEAREPLAVRFDRGIEHARVLGLIATRAPMDAPTELALKPWALLRSRHQSLDGRTSVKALLLISGAPPRPQVLPTSMFGFGLESTPGYEQLKAALVTFFSWRPEPGLVTQREALKSDNPYLHHLAAEALLQQGATDVVPFPLP
jgi:hypothetical protein